MKRPSPVEIWLFVLPLLIVPGYTLMHKGNQGPPVVPSPISAPTPSPTPTIRWSFKAQHSRVAAGAIPSDIHQSVFVIRARDAKGQPLADIAVELPELWNGGNGQEMGPHRGMDEAKDISPHVQWFSQGKMARTNKRGEVHGLFTSGTRAEPAVMSGPSNTQVAIEQVVNDNPDPFKGSDDLTGTNAVLRKSRRKTRWTMYLKRGAKILPVCGHRLALTVDSIILKVRRRNGKADKNGHPQLGTQSSEWQIEAPTSHASAREQARWKMVCSWIHRDVMKETSPGVYEGAYRLMPFDGVQKGHLVLEGKEIQGVVMFFSGIEDRSIFVDEPTQ
jgi:hypothetical protein